MKGGDSVKKYFLGALIFLILSTSCAFATTMGYLYTGVDEPTAASAIAKSTKKAEGSNMSILSLVAIGDASIEKVAKEAGIKEIKYIDKNTFSIWFFFTQETFTIYGN